MRGALNNSLKRNAVIFLTISGVVALTVFVFTSRPAPPDPICKGRPLSEWLSMTGWRLHEWEWEEIGAIPSDAIQAIGTNALPLIISELEVRDSRPRIWLQGILRKHHLDDWMRATAVYRHDSALSACVILETNSISVVPVIAELLSADVQLYTRVGAAWCLESLGTNAWAAIPALKHAVTEKTIVVVEEGGQTNDYAAKALAAIRGESGDGATSVSQEVTLP